MSQLAPVGDQGQRYEIVMLKTDGEQMRVGWQDSPEGGLLDAMSKAPYCAKIRVIDRRTPDSEPTVHKFRPTTAERRAGRPRRKGKKKNRRSGKGW